jgi:hypothetical protein
MGRTSYFGRERLPWQRRFRFSPAAPGTRRVAVAISGKPVQKETQ